MTKEKEHKIYKLSIQDQTLNYSLLKTPQIDRSPPFFPLKQEISNNQYYYTIIDPQIPVIENFIAREKMLVIHLTNQLLTSLSLFLSLSHRYI
jgi:hypothetical protein